MAVIEYCIEKKQIRNYQKPNKQMYPTPRTRRLLELNLAL
jgi:hypothetical protein